MPSLLDLKTNSLSAHQTSPSNSRGGAARDLQMVLNRIAPLANPTDILVSEWQTVVRQSTWWCGWMRGWSWHARVAITYTWECNDNTWEAVWERGASWHECITPTRPNRCCLRNIYSTPDFRWKASWGSTGESRWWRGGTAVLTHLRVSIQSWCRRSRMRSNGGKLVQKILCKMFHTWGKCFICGEMFHMWGKCFM